MFFITKTRVVEQQGEPEFYIKNEDLQLLFEDSSVRAALLLSLGKDKILVSGTEETGEVNLDFSDEIRFVGGGFHSKL